MKKLTIWLFSIALTFGFSACNFNSTKNSINPDAQLTENMVGSYYYVETLSEEDGDYDDFEIATIESFEEFRADNTCTELMVLKGILYDEDWDEYDLELKISVAGTWNIKDSCLQYNYAIDKTTIELVEPKITNREAKEELLRGYKKYLLPSINENLIATERHPPKIVKLTEGLLVLKTSDGEEIIMKRTTPSRIVESSKNKSKETTINLWKKQQNNLITPTSIAGVEVFGKTLKEIRAYLNPTLTLENGEIKNGETVLIHFGNIWEDSDVVSFVSILDRSLALATKGGIRIGSTSGDLLKAYPNATVVRVPTYMGDGEFTYIDIEEMKFGYHSEDGTVGKYSKVEDFDYADSQIVNKNVRISYIQIGFDENGSGD